MIRETWRCQSADWAKAAVMVIDKAVSPTAIFPIIFIC
jgi:hypothetical protein